MVKENAPARAVMSKGATDNSFGHDDWNSDRFVLWTRRLNEQPLGRREPLVRANDAIQIIFEFSAVDLALGILLKADGKASQRFFDRLQYASNAVKLGWSHGRQFRQPKLADFLPL